MDRSLAAQVASGLALAASTALAAGPAWAAYVPMTQAVSTSASDQPASDPVAAQVEEIVVTAQRRSESLSRAPLAITAVSGETLQAAGLKDITNIDAISPSVRLFNNNVSGLVIAVRGITTVTPALQGDAALALNIDDVNLARTFAVPAMLFDLERVEVLRGPQGTLYGRNATAGAVNIITRAPTDEFGGYATVEGGEYGLINVEGAVNLPMSDTLATRLSFQRIQRDGYISNGLSDQDQAAGRARVSWRPSDKVDALLTVAYAELSGRGVGGVALNAITGEALNPDEPWENTLYSPTAGRIDQKAFLASSTVNVDLGGALLTSVTGFHRFRSDSPDVATAGWRFNDVIRNRQFSQELRLASESVADQAGSFEWVVGAYYFTERSRRIYGQGGPIYLPENSPLALSGMRPARSVVQVQPFRQSIFSRIAADSWAVFGQGTYALTDTLRLTGGLRYTADEKDQVGIVAGGPTSGAPDSSQVNYKASVEWDATPEILTYATVSTGYHAGGAAEGLAPQTFYEPEDLTAYEAGLKARLFSNRMQLNLAAFHYDYQNFQLSAIVPSNPAVPTSPPQLNIFNVGSVSVTGFEAEARIVLTPKDRIELSLAHTDSRLEDVQDRPGATISCLCGPGLGPRTRPIFLSDLEGSRLTQAPLWAGNVSYTHTFDLPGGSSLDVRAQSRISSSYFASNVQVPETMHIVRQDSYTRSDLFATWHSSDDRFDVTAYVQNIEDDAQKTFVQVFPNYSSQPTPPRTYGLRLTARY